MHRAWSTENIVGMAQSGFARVRRLLRPAGGVGADEPTADLQSLCRRVDERNKQHGTHGSPEVFAVCFEGFVSEVRLVMESSQPGESCSPSSADSPPELVQSASADHHGKQRMKRAQENGIAMFFDVVSRIPPHLFEALAARPMIDCDVLDVMLRVHDNAGGCFSRRLIDASTACLQHILCAHPAMLRHICEALHNILARRSADMSVLTLQAVPLLRTMLLWGEILRRCDITAPELANEAKATWLQHGTVDLVRDLVIATRQQSMRSDQSRNVPTLLAIGTVALSLLGGLFRSNIPIKEYILSDDRQLLAFIENWAFFASGIDRMQYTITETHTHPSTSKPEELSITCESAAVWGSEMVGCILELATSGRFSLQRQLVPQHAEQDHDELEAPTEPLRPHAASGSAQVVPVSLRWEHIPANWDTMLGSAVLMPWRIASSVASCELNPKTARAVLMALAQLDLVEPTAEFIFKACTASLLCLCRANPTNIAVLHTVGAVDTIIAFMAPDSQVMPFAKSSVVPQATEGGPDVWPICAALLTTILSFHMGSRELAFLMGAIESMVHTPPTRDDCDAVETILAVVASSVYAPDFFCFNGSSSTRATAPLERFCGRWYGYSFVAWISSTCVWPDGGMIFSIRDPQLTSALALCIVSNGRTKCLAVRTATSKDQFSLVQIPEAIIGDRWHHIAVVHNIGGFNVYVDGRKCGAPSVNYPKEPTKPHRLTYTVGSGDRDLQVPTFFGLIATPQLIDGVVSEATLEKIAAQAAIGTPVIITEADKDLAHFAVRGSAVSIAGCLIKDDVPVDTFGVSHHAFPSVAQSLRDVNAFSWAKKVTKNLGTSAHRSSVAILTLELIAGSLQQLGPASAAEWMDAEGLLCIGAELLQWDFTQPEVISAFFALVMSDTTSRRFRDHPSTADTLKLIFDLIISTTPEGRAAALREVSEYLDEPSNAAFFIQHVGVGYLLDVTTSLEPSSVSEFVHVVEKIVRQPTELEAVLQFVCGPALDQVIAAKRGKPGMALVVKCELLRMLYEVAKARPTLLEMLDKVNGVNFCLVLLKSDSQDAELVRVIAIRLIALMVHANKKSRELFIRANHFDTIAAAILMSSKATRVGLPTFNALFKFALDFYRPASNDDAAVLSRIRESPSKSNKKAHADPNANGPSTAFNGHTPSMAQMRPLMCRAHSITSVGSSDMSDVDSRLASTDDAGDGTNRDTVAYPNCIAAVLRVLYPIAAAAAGQPVTGASTDDTDTGIGSDLPTSQDPTEKVVILNRVLKYLSRIAELQHNALTLAAQPWLEWMAPIVAVLTPVDGLGPCAAGPVVEANLRAVVKHIAVADISRARGVRTTVSVRRVRDMPDAPALQRLVMEEVVRHFANQHRLDTMDAEDATAVIRHVAESVFNGVEENISPFPMALGLEMVKAVETIAVNNNSWVRQKMKNHRAFELRDKLAMFLLSGCRNLATAATDAIETLRVATQHDVNASTVALRHLCDAAKERDVVRFDAAQKLLRTYYAVDDDQRRNISKTVGDAEVCERLLNERVVVDGAEVKAESMLLWIPTHEAQWEAVVQRVVRAAKAVEGDWGVKAERREKEHQAKIKTRKQENDKRSAATVKQLSEHERTFDELVGKSTAFASASVSAVEKDRKQRHEKYLAARVAMSLPTAS